MSVSWRGRLPSQIFRVTTAGRMACSARQWGASTDGSPRKAKASANLGVEMRGETLGVVERRGASTVGRFDEPTQAGEQSAADRRRTGVGQPAVVPAVA